MKRILLASLLLLGTLSQAAGQGGPEQRIQAARQRATQAGIPVALIDTKVSEGRAKGVPADRIAAAVERRLAALQRARDAMAASRAAGVSAADLAVGADALEEGVSPGVLGRLAVAAPPDRRAVAIAVLTQLVANGMASERALERVTAALARGPEALRQLPGEAAGGANAARRGPPETRGPGGEPGARGSGQGRGQGGPPTSVPGPKKPVDRGRP